MTFASVEEMKVVLEFVFNGLAIIGVFTLALAVVGACMMLATWFLQYANRKSIQVCTRPHPHECRVNGPCNGWPK